MLKTLCRTFLKQHMAVPNKFIDDLFSLYGQTTLQSDFVVDLDKVAPWLGMEKFTLMATLRDGYREGVDYTAVRTTRRKAGVKYGGNHAMTVMLTPDCFKRMCMRSNSVKAEQARTYFIKLEDLVRRYKDVMIEGMRADIARLEKNQKANVKDTPGPGWLYAFRAGKGLVKFGSAKDWLKRLRAYRTGRADEDEIHLLFKFRTENFREVEGCAKAFLNKKRYRKRREIYEVTVDELHSLVEGCDALGMQTVAGAGKIKKNAIGKGKAMMGGDGDQAYFIMLDDGSPIPDAPRTGGSAVPTRKSKATVSQSKSKGPQ